MNIVRIVVRVVAVLALLIGLLWIGQGTGLVMWPSSSFMLADRQWAWNGLGVVVVALVLLFLTRRR